MRTLQGRGHARHNAENVQETGKPIKWYRTDCAVQCVRCTGTPRDADCPALQRTPCRLATAAATNSAAQAPPELSLRGPEGAVAISGRQRRSLYKAAAREKNVAALSERHAGWQWLRHAFCGARPPDLSLRGPEGAVAISQNPVESWESSGEIVTAFPRLPRRCAPRNDTSGWCRGAPAPLRG